MERLKIFIAVTPPDDVRDDIVKIVDRLKVENHAVTWEEPGKEHITLAFLGNIEQIRMEEAAKAAEKTARNFPKFTIQTARISYFYKDKAGNDSIILLSISDPKKYLKKLHRTLAVNLTEHEFSPGTHFSAHITIGRLKKQRHPHEQKQLLDQIADIDIPIGHEFEVTHLNVYESILQGGTHRHHLLKSFELIG